MKDGILHLIVRNVVHEDPCCCTLWYMRIDQPAHLTGTYIAGVLGCQHG